MGKVVKTVAIVVGVAALLIPGVGAAIGLGLAGALGAGTAGFVVGALQLAAIGAGLSAGAKALGLGPKPPKISPATEDRLQVSLEPRAYRKIVLGRTAAATDARYQEYTGSDQEYLNTIIDLASHKLNSIDEIWFDDKLAWTSGGGVQGEFVGYLTVTTRTEGTTANAFTITGSTSWTAAHSRQVGLSYLWLRYKLTGNSKKSESPFSGGISARVTVRVAGAPMYDPRLDSTQGGSGSHRADDQTTWAWVSDDVGRNPALQLLWYLLGWRIQNPVTREWKLALGLGIPKERIDITSFIAAANLCDEPVALAGGGTEPRYRSDGILSEGDDPSLVYENLLATMNGSLRDAGGRLALDVLHNDLGSPVIDLGPDDVIGEFEWNQTPAIDQIYNAVRGQYVDASDAGLYQLADYPDVSIPSRDGIDRPTRLALPMTQSASQAQRLAKAYLQRSQYPGTFTADFLASAWRCQVGRIVRLTFPALGFSAKLFRVVEHMIRFDGRCTMTLREEHANIYVWDAEEAAAVVAAAPIQYNPLNDPVLRTINEMDEGATRNVNRGAWSSAGVAYVPGDFVTKDGSSWTSKTTHTSTGGNGPPTLPTTENTNWKLATQAGSDGADGDYFETIFIASSTAPATPADVASPANWATTPNVTSAATHTQTGSRNKQITGNRLAAVKPGEVYKVRGTVDNSAGLYPVSIYLTMYQADRVTPVSYPGTSTIAAGASGDVYGEITVPAGAAWMRMDTLINDTFGGSPPGGWGTAAWTDIRMLNPPTIWASTCRRSAAGAFVTSRSAPSSLSGASGDSPVVGLLTNESHTVPASSAGVVSSYSGASGTFRVFFGLVDVSSLFTLSTQSNPQALTVGYVDQTYSITAGLDAGEDLATLTIRATGTGIFAGKTVDKVFTLAKSKAGTDGAAGATGAAGANAKTLTLLSDRQTIAYDGAGSPTPSTQTTTFSTNKQNTTATVNWSITDAAGAAQTPTTDFLSAATGNSVTMTQSQFAAARNGTAGVIVTATLTDGATISDKISIVRVQAGTDGSDGADGTDGDPGLTSSVSPGSVAVPCYAGGTPKGAIPSIQIFVYAGDSTNVAGSCSFTVTKSGFSSVSNDGGGVFTPTGMTADSAWVEIEAVYGGVPTTQRVEFTKIEDAPAFSQKQDTTIGLPPGTSYSGEQGGPLTLGVGDDGTITLTANLSYQPASGSTQVAGKVRYRTTPGSGSWIDVASETNGTLAIFGDDPGALAIYETLAGPTSAANWEFDLQLRRSGGTVLPSTLSGKFTTRWDG